jgi:hypothetical protein
MGNKIITEKDFWMCTGGNVPAPLQSIQLSTKKKDGKKYITKVDTATSSYIDFGCNKLMLIMAIVAAVIAVAVVATGGAALIAIGALAGAAGAVFGAVLGGLICGQIAKMARVWLGSKDNMIIQGKPAITSGHEMKCMLFGDKITHAPNIKNWWQAISLAGANYVGGILEGMMAGAAVGMGGAFISGGRAAFMQGGTRALGRAGLELLKTMPKNFGVNAIESFGKFGLALRGVMGAQNTAATYGNTGTASLGDFAAGTFAMETGAYDSFNNIKEGKGTWQDYVGMAMMVAPVGKGKRDLENEIGNKIDDAEAKKTDEDGALRPEIQDADVAQQKVEHDAFEMGSDLDKSIFDAGGMELNPIVTNRLLHGQSKRNTCVASSLKMILDDMGIKIDEDVLAEKLGTTDNGVSVGKVPEALSKLDINTNVQARPNITIDEMASSVENGKPVIASVNIPGKGSHAIVIDGVGNGQVLIRDPLPMGTGSSYSVSLNDFETYFTGRGVIFK